MFETLKVGVDKVLHTFLIGLLFAFTAVAQTPAPPPTPHPLPPSISLREIEENAKRGAVTPGERRKNRVPDPPIHQNIDPEKDPWVNRELLEQYKNYTGSGTRGFTRLFPNFDCEKKGVITVYGDCRLHVVGRSEVRFRHGTPFPDIRYNNGNFLTGGFLSLSVIQEIGDVDLESVDISTRAAAVMKNLRLEENFPEVRKQVIELRRGKEFEGIFLSNKAPVKNGSVYILRSVGFRTSYFRTHTRSRYIRTRRLNSDALLARYDRRIDMIIAFKVVEMDSDGSVHIIWKQLHRQKAPKLPILIDHDPQDLW